MRTTSLLALGAAVLLSGEPVLGSRCKPSPPASSTSSLLSSSSSIAPTSPSPESSVSISSSASSSTISSSVSPVPSSSPSSISSVVSSVSASVSSVSSSSSVASASPSPSLCPNLILNPNFAQGSDGLTSWRLVATPQIPGSHTYGPSSDCGTNPGDPATCFESYNAATARSYTYFYQDNVPVVPGQTYTFSFRYRVVSITAVDILYSFINGAALGTTSLAPTTVTTGIWHTFTTSAWTAPTVGLGSYLDTSKAILEFVNGDVSAAVRIQFSDVFMNSCAQGSYV